jgi:adenylate kinase
VVSVIISITGTPGVGKTAAAKLVSKKLGARLIRLNSFIRRRGIADGHDKKRGAMIVDVQRMRNAFSRLVKNKGCIVVDGHLSHFLSADMVFVLRLDPMEIEKRLRRKGFSRAKVAENVQSEILDIIYAEALEQSRTGRVVQIDATGKTKSQVAGRILNTLCHKKYKSDKVSWMEKYGCYLEKGLKKSK